MEGLKKWTTRQFKWQNTLKSKSQEEIDYINKLKHVNRETNFYSDESIVKLKPLYEKLKNFNLKIYWMDNEYCIDKNNKLYFYDFTIPFKKIIIEYNGSKLHPSPLLSLNEQQKWQQLYTNNSYNKVFQNDIIKNNVAMEEGFNLFIIWDYFTKEDINKIFDKIIKLCSVQ